MRINSVRAGAVEVSRKRPEGALEIRRTARYVVPGIPDLISRRWIKSKRVPIAVQRAVKRHAGIDSVIQGTFHDVGELCVTGGGQHSPVPHHVADGGTAFPVSAEIRQLVGVSEGLPV